MRLSNRINTLINGTNDGWGLYYKAQAMNARGIDVIALNIGEHDIHTDPAILNAMARAAANGHTGYAVVPGTDGLREAVAARVQARTGVDTGPQNVLITAGGQAALFAAHHAVCDEGDTALLCDPYYVTYPGTIRAVGARPHPVKARPETGFVPQGDDITRAARNTGARSLLINSPNNPTGVVYGPDALSAISEAVIETGLWLISDEVYETQVWDGGHTSPRQIEGMAGRTLVVGSMSKSHAMTGSRIGWIVGPQQAIEKLINLATHTTYGVPGYIQDAAEFALRQGHPLEERIAAPFRRRRALAQELMNTRNRNIVRMVPCAGAMYVLLDIRATGLSGEAFGLKLLEEEAIAVMPGESFGSAAAGHVRIAMTVDDEQFADAFGRILSFAQRITR